MPTISKSTYIYSGLVCPLLLWAKYHKPDLIPPVDESLQARFDLGHEIGALAQTLYPKGILIPRADSVPQTQLALKQKKPLFEAAFAFKNAYCQLDVLEPHGKVHDLIEVKASTQVKDEHVQDVAFQLYTAEGAGIKIRKAFLMLVNNEYVKKGPIDVKKLLKLVDITKEARAFIPEVEPNINRMLTIIKGPKPSILLGIDCVSPNNCPIHSQSLPEILDLGSSKKFYDLANQGIKLKDVPDDILNDKQKVIKHATITKKPFVNKKAIDLFLKELRYPLYLFDFETINPGIPLFDGTRPYRKIPFQFSLRIVEKRGAKPRHVEFLVDHPNDPRPEIVQAMKSLDDTGTILAYNASFEKGVIEDLAEAFPEEPWLRKLNARFVDLLVPFRNQAYYHPDQHGSNSLKEVLPALTGTSYANLEIGEGNAAAEQFLDAMYKKGKVDEKLRHALLQYCAQDTQAMADILNVLEKASK
jgi:hypothetical protein